jgi:hypothetical protein
MERKEKRRFEVDLNKLAHLLDSVMQPNTFATIHIKIYDGKIAQIIYEESLDLRKFEK